MTRNSRTVAVVKGQLSKFSGIISQDLPKAKRRLVREIIYGIQAAKDAKLSNITRSLNEPFSLIKTEFNHLIGNADAHAKNLAMLFTDRGPQLAPFYDLLSTQVYPDLTDRQAIRIGGENRPSWIQRRHWERFSEAIAIKPRLVLNTLQNMTTAIMPVAEGLAEEFQKTYGTSTIIEKILAVIRKRAETIKT
jgi:hypothetical protein